MRPTTASPIAGWIVRWPRARLYVASVSGAEIEFGLAVLPMGRRKDDLKLNAGALWEPFEDRILPFDHQAAVPYASIASARRSAGRPIGDLDAQIAAIAVVNGMSIATRNVRDFADSGPAIINPWQG